MVIVHVPIFLQCVLQASGTLGPRHPDFVHAGDRRRALWLDGRSTPPEVHKVMLWKNSFVKQSRRSELGRQFGGLQLSAKWERHILLVCAVSLHASSQHSCVTGASA